MYKTFDSFYEERNDQQFAEQFHALCENIALSEMSFEQYWQEHAVPVLVENGYESTDELFGLLEAAPGLVTRGLGAAAGHLGRWGQRFGRWGADKLRQGANYLGRELSPEQWAAHGREFGRAAAGAYGANRAQQQPQMSDEDMERDARRQVRLNQGQQDLDRIVAQMKSEFKKQMRDFLGAMQTNSLRNSSKLEFDAAKAFYDKMMKTAAPVLDDYALKAAWKKRDPNSEFNRRQTAMRKTYQDGLRQKHAQSQGNIPNISPKKQQQQLPFQSGT